MEILYNLNASNSQCNNNSYSVYRYVPEYQET
jgi:hypothetical protein